MSDPDQLAARLFEQSFADFQRQCDGLALRAMAGTTATMVSWTDQKGLTVKDITDAMAKLPPRETWVVSAIFPPKKLTLIKTAGENFTGMDQAMWDDACSKVLHTATVAPFGLVQIRPFFLDDDHTAQGPSKWHAEERDRILGKITKAYGLDAKKPPPRF